MPRQSPAAIGAHQHERTSRSPGRSATGASVSPAGTQACPACMITPRRSQSLCRRSPLTCDPGHLVGGHRQGLSTVLLHLVDGSHAEAVAGRGIRSPRPLRRLTSTNWPVDAGGGGAIGQGSGVVCAGGWVRSGRVGAGLPACRRGRSRSGCWSGIVSSWARLRMRSLAPGRMARLLPLSQSTRWCAQEPRGHPKRSRGRQRGVGCRDRW
jgi:hypothetical protein